MNEPELRSETELTEGHVPMDDLVAAAERELAAFVNAVSESLGPSQAGLSADVWIEELLSMDFPDGSRIPDWRRITIMAASRLAKRSTITAFRQSGLIGGSLASAKARTFRVMLTNVAFLSDPDLTG
jgi:hypothetical protein